MSDPISFILFFLIFVPFLLMNFNNVRKSQKEIVALLRESNRLLAEIANKKDVG